MKLDHSAIENGDIYEVRQKAERRVSTWRAVALVVVGVIAAASTTSYYYISYKFEDYVENFIYTEMERQLRHLQVHLSKKQLERGGKWQDEFFLDYNNPTGKKYWQLSLGDQIILKSPSLGDGQLSVPEDEVTSSRVEYYGTGPNGVETLLVRGFVAGEQLGFESPALLMLAVSHAEVSEQVDRFKTDLLLFLVVIWAAAAGAAALAMCCTTRPLTRLMNAVESVRLGQARRVPTEDQPVELAPIARELNHLIEQQEMAQDRSRTRAASLAHNLKTPLATIMVELDHSEKGGELQVERIASEVKRIENAVRRELSRTRIRSTAHGVSRRTVIGPLISSLVTLQQRLPSGASLDWKIDLDHDLAVAIDTEDFAEIAGNLLDNARKWSREAIHVRAHVERGMVLFSVEDDGAGPPESMETIFIERGLRLDETVSGSGVGLSIVYDILVECGGDIEISRSKLGGFAAKVSIPAAS